MRLPTIRFGSFCLGKCVRPQQDRPFLNSPCSIPFPYRVTPHLRCLGWQTRRKPPFRAAAGGAKDRGFAPCASPSGRPPKRRGSVRGGGRRACAWRTISTQGTRSNRCLLRLKRGQADCAQLSVMGLSACSRCMPLRVKCSCFSNPLTSRPRVDRVAWPYTTKSGRVSTASAPSDFRNRS
jgi:hypothetical protein